MAKSGSVVTGALIAVAAGGYYAYEETSWFKSKPQPPAPRETGSGSGTSGEGSTAIKKPKKDPVVPDLIGLELADAEAAVKKAGFEASALTVLDDRTVCRYASDKEMLPVGQICGQEPSAGATGFSRIKVVVQADTYEHGGEGTNSEWRRMPDVVGQSVEAALATLVEKGFAEAQFTVDRTGSCARGTVCYQTPEGDARKVLAAPGKLTVGK